MFPPSIFHNVPPGSPLYPTQQYIHQVMGIVSVFSICLALLYATGLGDHIEPTIKYLTAGIKWYTKLMFVILFFHALFHFLTRRYKKDDNSSNEFQNIDRYYKKNDTSKVDSILAEIHEQLQNNKNISADEVRQIVSGALEENNILNKQKYNSFENYFISIITRLEKQIEISDEKASKLLDKGVSYTKFGIAFFISSIVAWQLLCLSFGYKEHVLYGIISCSLLFIFIEFISAWFLKQYKSFVDTSTYLIKIKSIFDKYILCHYTIKEATTDNVQVERMLAIISSDIKWPETYLLKNADNGFAKEVMDSMTCFAEAMKSHVQDKSKNDEKK